MILSLVMQDKQELTMLWMTAAVKKMVMIWLGVERPSRHERTGHFILRTEVRNIL